VNGNDRHKEIGANIDSGNDTKVEGDVVGGDKRTTFHIQILSGKPGLLFLGIVAIVVVLVFMSQSSQPQAAQSNVGVVSLSVEGDTRSSENVRYVRCPNAEVQIQGAITAEGKGTVDYALVHYSSPAGKEEMGPVETVYFDGPRKSIAVRGNFLLPFSDGKHYYEVYLQTKRPVQQRSEPVYVTVECADVPPDPVDFGFETPSAPPPDSVLPPS
jgi:hypothetical protein